MDQCYNICVNFFAIEKAVLCGHGFSHKLGEGILFCKLKIYNYKITYSYVLVMYTL